MGASICAAGSNIGRQRGLFFSKICMGNSMREPSDRKRGKAGCIGWLFHFGSKFGGGEGGGIGPERATAEEVDFTAVGAISGGTLAIGTVGGGLGRIVGVDGLGSDIDKKADGLGNGLGSGGGCFGCFAKKSDGLGSGGGFANKEMGSSSANGSYSGDDSDSGCLGFLLLRVCPLVSSNSRLRGSLTCASFSMTIFFAHGGNGLVCDEVLTAISTGVG